MNYARQFAKKFVGSLFKQIILSSCAPLKIILMYHRTVNELPKMLHDPNMFITANTLDRHINEIKKYFEIVALTNMLDAAGNNERLCALTFDDGWKDNFDYGFPILKNNNVGATVFIPVMDVENSNWFWFEHIFYLANFALDSGSQKEFVNYMTMVVPDWNCQDINISSLLALIELIKKRPANYIQVIVNNTYCKFKIDFPRQKILIDWQQIDTMGMSGILFGSHGMRHDILPLLDKKSKIEAVFESLSILMDKSNCATPFFSYPNGNWDYDIIEMVGNAGYKGATTTQNGCIGRNVNPYLLNRIGCSEISSSSTSLLWYQIAKAYFATKTYM